MELKVGDVVEYRGVRGVIFDIRDIGFGEYFSVRLDESSLGIRNIYTSVKEKLKYIENANISDSLKTEFRIGDQVEWCGVRGVVDDDEPEFYESYPITVEFDCEVDFDPVFTLDGKFSIFHKEPSLKLISRKLYKSKRYKVLYADKSSPDVLLISDLFYESEDDFELKNYPLKLKFIKLIEETMIEVEE